MASLDDRDIVEELILAGGHCRDGDYEEPPVLKIVRYTTVTGDTSYGLVYPADPPDYYKPTPYVLNPKVIFEHASDCARCQAA